MKVVQESDALDALVVRRVALGLLLASAVCGAAAVVILKLELGVLAPRGFVASRTFARQEELAAVELGLFRDSSRPAGSAVNRDHEGRATAAPGVPSALPMDRAVQLYLAGARPPRTAHDPRLDYSQVLPGASP
jgi:hypothetical protein